MTIPKQSNLKTLEEYLAKEKTAPEKSEFHNGEILSMSGGTIVHSKIAARTVSALIQALEGTLCEVYESNLMVRIESANSIVYPDTTVICGPPEIDERREHVAKNPIMIVEVLSESTGAYDRGEKFHLYQQIPSFREYMLIEQKAPQIDVFHKNNEGKWMVESYFGLDSIVELHSLGIKIALSSIYKSVNFEA